MSLRVGTDFKGEILETKACERYSELSWEMSEEAENILMMNFVNTKELSSVNLREKRSHLTFH